MAEGMNRVFLMGNLGADPELRTTQGGQHVLSLRLATTESYLDANRERKDRTEWHRVSVWGKRAEGLYKILAKGRGIMVEGSIRYGSYEKDGTTVYTTDISAKNIILQPDGKRGDGGGGGGGGYQASSDGQGYQAPAGAPPAAPAAPTPGDVDPFEDVPF